MLDRDVRNARKRRAVVQAEAREKELRKAQLEAELQKKAEEAATEMLAHVLAELRKPLDKVGKVIEDLPPAERLKIIRDLLSTLLPYTKPKLGQENIKIGLDEGSSNYDDYILKLATQWSNKKK